jgi:hypothetical protein
VIPASLVLRLKQAARGKPEHARLLVKSSGAAWGKSQHNRGFARAVEAAGMDAEEITANALRHSSIVRQIKAHVPIRLVAALHDTSIKMIESHYSKHIASVAENVPVLDLSETRTNVVPMR